MFATNGKHLLNPSNAEATLLQSTGKQICLLSGLVHITRSHLGTRSGYQIRLKERSIK